MSDLTPITREEALLDGADLEPITRKEQFIKRIYDKTQEVPTPITREEWFLNKAGEGGSEVTVEQLNATENGTYSEPGKAYSPVIVEVPAPTLKTKTITENGTYNASSDNADGYSSVTVAVEGFKKKSIANTPTDIASFNDGTANPMPSLEISIKPVQSGSGDPSPSNVRPISGWSGANVTRTGKNLFGGEKLADVIVSKVPYATKNTTNKTVSYSASRINNIVLFENFKPNTQYTIIANMDSGVPNLKISYSDGTKTTIQSNNVTASTAGKTVVSLDGEWQTGDSVLLYEQFEIYEGVITAQDFEPYNGSTLSIPFHDSSDNPITVYGGTLDVTSGELTATYGLFDMGVINWTKSSSTGRGRFYGASNKSIFPYKFSDSTKMICEVYKFDGIGSQNVGYYGANGTFRYYYTTPASDARELYLVDNAKWDSMTAEEFKQSVTGKYIVYELATPQTYQLTPTQVTTLLGQNNIFADCGQILEGEYFVTL